MMNPLTRRIVLFSILAVNVGQQPLLVNGWLIQKQPPRRNQGSLLAERPPFKMVSQGDRRNPFYASTRASSQSDAPPSSTTTTRTTEDDNNVTSEDNKKTEATKLRELYPHWNVLQNGTLQVDDVHTLSYQVYGSDEIAAENGLIGLFLHGGPGAGCYPNHVRFFDPQRYSRIVLFDQRGCGQSTPKACLQGQTLQDLVEDCEQLKQHLNLTHWDCILGGSWGTTLALAYAQAYPKSVKSIILRGIFLLRSEEIGWLFASTGGAARLYPEQYNKFCNAVGVKIKDEDNVEKNPRAALEEYYQRLWNSSNETQRMDAARSWMSWEFWNSVADKIPASVNTSDSNATMKALREWKPPITNGEENPPVAVYSPNTNQWSYESSTGDEISLDQLPPNRSTDDASVQDMFRQNIGGSVAIKPEYADEMLREKNAMPLPFISSTGSTESIKSHKHDEHQHEQQQLPVQAMLTCYYSTNNDYCGNFMDLLSPERMEALANIPCIAIQGGSDGICPPDSALNLLEAWRFSCNTRNDNETKGMELRIPMYSGHSMYDPYITNELIQATDRIGDYLLSQRKKAE